MWTERVFDLHHPAQEVGQRLDDVRLRRWHIKCDPSGGEPGLFACRRQQPIVPDALEPGRQHMAQKAPNELGARQADRSFLAA